MHPRPRTPSPHAPPPIPHAPGPRATGLTKLYSDAIAKITSKCSYANFAACFPTPARYAPEVLRSVWTQVVGMIQAKAAEEFDAIMRERDVVGRLNAWEAVVADAGGRRRGEGAAGGADRALVAPHTLPPEELFKAHLTPHLAPIQEKLEAEIRMARARNEELVTRILAQRDEVERIVGSLEAVVRDLEGAGSELEGLGEAVKAGMVGGEKAGVRMVDA